MKKVWSNELRDEKNVSAAFVFTCPKAPASALLLRMAASNVYQVYCNGEFVAYGPMRSAHGYSHLREYAVTVDPGTEARVVVIVAGYRVNSFYTVDEEPFFAAEIYRGGEKIADTFDFAMYRLDDRRQMVQRYSYQRTFVESYVFDGRREQLFEGSYGYPVLEMSETDGNQLVESSLSEPDYHRVTGAVVEHGSADYDENLPVPRDRALTGEGCHPDYQLIPESELDEVLSAEAARIVCSPDRINAVPHHLERGYKLFDFGRNLSGFFCFKATVPAHATVYLLFDEIATVGKNGGLCVDAARLQCCNCIKWELSEGEHELISFEPYTCRYARLVVLTGGADVESLSLITYENPDDRLKFVSKDADLVRIVDAAKSTFRQNAVDVLTDCPSRERAGWLCDSFFTSRAELLLTGENKVEKNLLNCFLLAPDLPGAKGMVPMCYPSDHPNGEYIPNWSMWFILELRDFKARTGDGAFVLSCKKKVYDIIAFLDRFLCPEGLLENLESWIFVEWSRANDFVQGVNFPSNMLYAAALECAGELFDDRELTARAAALRAKIIELSFDGEFFSDNALRDEDGALLRTEHTTETCQYYAFWTDVADRESFPKLYDVLFEDFGPDRDPAEVYPNVYPSNAFIGNLLRLDYLFRMRRFAQVLSECKGYYLPMAEKTGTLWENMTTCASCNHGFAGYISYLVVGSATGLLSCRPAEKRVVIARPGLKVKSKLVAAYPDGKLKLKARSNRIKIHLPKGYELVQE